MWSVPITHAIAYGQLSSSSQTRPWENPCFLNPCAASPLADIPVVGTSVGWEQNFQNAVGLRKNISVFFHMTVQYSQVYFFLKTYGGCI